MNKKRIITGCIFIVLVILSSQAKSFAAPDNGVLVTVTTQSATDIQETSAIVHGTVDNISQYSILHPRQHGICWNTAGGPDIEDLKTELGSVSQPTVFTSTMKNLAPGTTYYVRTYATLNFYGTTYGNEVSFQTLKKPSVTTLAVTEIGSTTAIGNGTLAVLGVPAPIQHGVCWDTGKNPTIDDEKSEEGGVDTVGDFTSRMTGLKPDTKYYVRAYATNLVATVYGKQKEFRTQSGEPIVSTQAVTTITTETATANATLVDLGNPTATHYGVCWSTSSMPVDNPETCIDLGEAEEDGPYQIEIIGLEPGTPYYVRAFASNETDVYHYGDEVSFVTLSLPIISTQKVSNISTNKATGNGTLVALGLPELTAYGICWNIGGSPIITDSCLDLGTAEKTGTFTLLLTDLVPDTPYFVRAFATNQAGTVYGEERSFKTPDEASAPRAIIDNHPPDLTRQTAYQFKISGNRIVAYRYSVDNGPWSEAVGVEEQLAIGVDTEGLHWLLVIGGDDAGIWQAEQAATMVTWTLDTQPPQAELYNYPTGRIGSSDIEVRVGGLDVEAYRYRLDGGEWNSITSLAKPIQIKGIPEGRHSLQVIGVDRANNWQTEENATKIDWETDLKIPTAVLQNLPDPVTSATSVSIQVTSSEGGVPIEKYDYTLNGSNTWWYGAAEEPIEITRLNEGEHSICVNAFGNGIWQDGSTEGTASTENATCYHWRVDLTPADPAQIFVENGPPVYMFGQIPIGSRTAKLSWVWTSEDDQKAIKRYRIWHSESEITEDNLDQATELFCERQPGPQDFLESWVVSGLDTGKTHYFALKSIDMAGNLSDLSNVVKITIGDNDPVISVMAFDKGGLTTDNSAEAELVVEGQNFVTADNGNLIRFENHAAAFTIFSSSATSTQVGARIPMGTPTGIYEIRILNYNGISQPGPEKITITDAIIPLPAVRNISPTIASIGQQTSIQIIGDHFHETASVMLVSPMGDATPLEEVVVLSTNTMSAVVAVPDDFPEGSYDVRVINSETAYNQYSIEKLELVVPINLTEASGTVDTGKIIHIEKGVVPVNTILKTDDSSITGFKMDKRLKMKVILPPGLVFEAQGQSIPYNGTILPPREQRPTEEVVAALGVGAIQLVMGAPSPIYLKDGATFFASLDVVLTSPTDDPIVYYIDPEGDIVLAGVDGTWQGMELTKGGTILATRIDVPNKGMTTYTIGLLLEHMSAYAVGSLSTSSNPANFQRSDDKYGPCAIESLRSDDGTHHFSGLLFFLGILLIVTILLYRLSLIFMPKRAQRSIKHRFI